MPADSATSDMKPMYGNIHRVITTAASCASSGQPRPAVQTSTGAPITPMTQVASSAHSSTVATASIRWRVASSPSLARGGRATARRPAERALGEEPPQHVGNAERHVVGVGHRVGAEQPRHHLFADQPRDARQQREDRNDGGGAEQVHSGDGAEALRRQHGNGAWNNSPGASSPGERPRIMGGPPRTPYLGFGFSNLAAVLAVFAPTGPIRQWRALPKPRRKPCRLGLGPQARTSRRQAERRQLGAALEVPHGHQERAKGDRHG